MLEHGLIAKPAPIAAAPGQALRIMLRFFVCASFCENPKTTFRE
jgi:hypothetical protein